MIDQDELAAARERLDANPDKARAATDVALFDRVLTAAQGYDPFERDMVELGLTFVGLNPPDPVFCQRMLPHDIPFDQRDIGTKRSLCGVLRERLLEGVGVDWDELHRPLARRAPQPSRLPPITAEKAFGEKHKAIVDATTWEPGSEGVHVADGLFVGNPGGARGVWSKGGDFDGLHARTVALVEGDEIVTIDGGGPGNHFAHLRVVEVDGQLWTMAWDAPAKGRRVFAVARSAKYPVRT